MDWIYVANSQSDGLIWSSYLVLCVQFDMHSNFYRLASQLITAEIFMVPLQMKLVRNGFLANKTYYMH